MAAKPAFLRRKMLRLADGLRERFGRPRRKRRGDLLDALIQTLLSQSTTDHNRDIAFTRLKERFRDWDAVAGAREAEIAEAVRPAGLGNQKAARIRAFLVWLRKERGAASLEFLHDTSTGEAVEMLTRHKGIGVKTAYVTLMIASGRDVFPVDVHIHRICRRLGLIGEKVTPEKAHGALAPLVPPGRAHELHMNLLAFGRTVCTARPPQCGECACRRMCPYGKSQKGDSSRKAAKPAASSGRPARRAAKRG
ncbi:MAG: endonuclease III [bacterium]